MDKLNEYEGLNDPCLLSTIDKNAVSDDTLTIFILTVRSLAKHSNNIVRAYRCLKNDVVGFTETQMKLSDSTPIIDDDTLKDFNMN